MRATEYGLLHYGNYSFTDIKSNIYAFNNEISVVNDETNENESSAYTEIIYVEIEPNDGNPNEFKLAEDGEILDYREGNYILNSNVIPAMEVSDSATVFLQTLSIQARICKFGEKYFALVTKNMAGAVAWETFLGGLEIVATQMKKKKREKITLLNDILREKQLSVVLFISKDGALLETAYQSIDNLYGNEIVLFIETNDSMNLFGSVIRIKTGANVSSSSGVPYKKLSKVVDYFNTNVSSSALQEIIKEHIADKSSGFFIVKRAFWGAVNRVVRFSSDLTLEGIGKISDGIGELVGALKLDDSQWQYYDDNGLPLKNVNLFLPGLGGIKYLQETNKKSRPEETNAKAINKITELEKILKESKKTLGKADFFKKIINQLLYMLRKVKDFLGDPFGKALDFAETIFVLYNAYIVGIINSIVDAIKGIFDILSIICKALAALQKKGKNIAENLPSYLRLFFEIIENMIETLENLFSKENLKALIEFFKKSAAFILTLPTRAFAWLAENAGMPNLDKVAYYYGYIIGFIIQLILEILFTGGAKTAADAFKKLADSLINIFKTMEKFVFKFSDELVIGFENLLAIFAYIREKSKNLGVFLDEVLEIIKNFFRNKKANEIFEGDFLAKWEKIKETVKGGTGFLGGQKLNRARIRHWIQEINKVSEGKATLRIAEEGSALFNSLKGNRAGFNPFNQELILQKGMTEYEILHEFKHLEEFSAIGRDEYIKGMKVIGGSPEQDMIRTYKREMYVYNEIIKQAHKFNKKELKHAKSIIDYIIVEAADAGIDLKKIKI